MVNEEPPIYWIPREMVNEEHGALGFEIVEVSFSLRLLLSFHFSFSYFFWLKSARKTDIL